MEIEDHYKEYQEIIKKYKLDDEDKAEEIATFLTKGEKNISAKEFADLFAMTEHEAYIFLSFIQRGIEFKKNQEKI